MLRNVANSDDDEQASKEEGGPGNPDPPSSVPNSEEGGHTIEPEILDEDIAPEVKAEILQVAQRALSWRGPLPPPDVYEEFKRIDPELAEAIKRDYIRRSDQRYAESESDIRSTERDYDLEERNLKINEMEVESDIQIRRRGQIFSFAFLPFVVVLGLIGVIWGPHDAGSYVVLGIIVAAIPIATAITIIKGRLTDNETDVMKTAIPHLSRQSSATAKSAEKELPANTD